VHLAPVPAGVDRQRHHAVQAELGQVRQVFAPQTAARAQLGAHQAQAAEALGAGAVAAEVREVQARGLADHHPLHLAAAAHQHAELPVELVRQLHQVAGQLGGDQAVAFYSPTERRLEPLRHAGLEALGRTVELPHA
jgi:hypothetical protein